MIPDSSSAGGNVLPVIALSMLLVRLGVNASEIGGRSLIPLLHASQPPMLELNQSHGCRA